MRVEIRKHNSLALIPETDADCALLQLWKGLNPWVETYSLGDSKIKTLTIGFNEEMMNKTLNCVYCGKETPINEMFSVDACCEDHQNKLSIMKPCPVCGSEKMPRIMDGVLFEHSFQCIRCASIILAEFWCRECAECSKQEVRGE